MKRLSFGRPNWQQLMAGCACLFLLGGQAQESSAIALSSLLAGETLSVGSARFSQWQVLQSDTTTGGAIDFAQIQVNAFATSVTSPGLQFLPGTQFSTSGLNAIDLVLRYRVDPLPGAGTFTSLSAELTSHTFASTGEVAYIASELTDGSVDLGAAVVHADNSANLMQLTDTQAFAAKSRVVVTTNVFVTGTATTDAAMIGSMVQRFAQNGPAAKAGDFNQNGVVDAADYTAWRDRVGAAAGTLPNDTAGGVIGAAQYNLWKANFGGAGSGAAGGEPGAPVAAAVPEPAAILVLISAVTIGLGTLRRRCGGG